MVVFALYLFHKAKRSFTIYAKVIVGFYLHPLKWTYFLTSCKGYKSKGEGYDQSWTTLP